MLYLSVSQSGGSPDLVAATEAARAQGALTVAVTNTPASPLSDAAELSVDIKAGEELAVAATKTYSATLLSLYLLVDAVRGGTGEAVAGIGELAARALDAPIEDAVERYRDIERMVTTGRGYSSATAAEAALKLAETSYLAARAYSGADLLHGPVAAIDSDTGVVAVTSRGHGGAAMRDVVAAVRKRGADVLAVGSSSRRHARRAADRRAGDSRGGRPDPRGAAPAAARARAVARAWRRPRPAPRVEQGHSHSVTFTRRPLDFPGAKNVVRPLAVFHRENHGPAGRPVDAARAA